MDTSVDRERRKNPSASLTVLQTLRATLLGYKTWNSREALKRIAEMRTAIMQKIVDHHGGNRFPQPHLHRPPGEIPESRSPSLASDGDEDWQIDELVSVSEAWSTDHEEQS